jgi:hypothetical protein
VLYILSISNLDGRDAIFDIEAEDTAIMTVVYIPYAIYDVVVYDGGPNHNIENMLIIFLLHPPNILRMIPFTAHQGEEAHFKIVTKGSKVIGIEPNHTHHHCFQLVVSLILVVVVGFIVILSPIGLLLIINTVVINPCHHNNYQ